MTKFSSTITAACIMIATIAVMSGLLGCARSGDGKGGTKTGLKVVTSLYPLYDFARNVGGDKVEVILIMPPGVEPHSFEPRPADLVMLNNADLFIYTNKYMEPWAEKLVRGLESKKVEVVDSSKGISFMEEDGEHDHHHEPGGGHEAHVHEGMDPHIWLDPANAEKMVDNIADGLVVRDPANRDYYLKNAAAFKSKLKALDSSFKKGLSDCATREIISGGHNAFGYLARRYSLTIISAYGFSPDSEPTPAQLVKISKLLKRKKAGYIFYEEMLLPRVAEMLSKETGARMLFLNGIHNISREDFEKGTSFIALMKMNLENLEKGLQCKQQP